jgi:hypothetical protein
MTHPCSIRSTVVVWFAKVPAGLSFLPAHVAVTSIGAPRSERAAWQASLVKHIRWLRFALVVDCLSTERCRVGYTMPNGCRAA